MVSGIGPKSALQTLGIKVLLDKPGVGQGMWDHVSLAVIQQVDVETQSELSDPAKALKAAEDYTNTHSGILTSNGADYIGKYLTYYHQIKVKQESN